MVHPCFTAVLAKTSMLRMQHGAGARWGHRRESRFAMASAFVPTPTADGFQV
jgi:hypothetical protein